MMAFAAAALPIITLAASAASGVVSYMGAKQSASAQAQMYNYQSQVAANNAIIANKNAQAELAVSEQKAMQTGIAGRQRIGAIRAAQGASGVDVDTGSAGDVVAGQRTAEGIDLQTIRDTGSRKAYDYLTQQYGDLTQAELDTKAAGFATTAGDIKAAGSLIGGATSVADKWMNYNKLGLLAG